MSKLVISGTTGDDDKNVTKANYDEVNINWSSGNDFYNIDLLNRDLSQTPDNQIRVEFKGHFFTDFYKDQGLSIPQTGLTFNNSGSNFTVSSNLGKTTISKPVDQIDTSFSNDIIYGKDVYQRIVLKGGTNEVTLGNGENIVEFDIDNHELVNSYFSAAIKNSSTKVQNLNSNTTIKIENDDFSPENWRDQYNISYTNGDTIVGLKTISNNDLFEIDGTHEPRYSTFHHSGNEIDLELRFSDAQSVGNTISIDDDVKGLYINDYNGELIEIEDDFNIDQTDPLKA